MHETPSLLAHSFAKILTTNRGFHPDRASGVSPTLIPARVTGLPTKSQGIGLNGSIRTDVFAGISLRAHSGTEAFFVSRIRLWKEPLISEPRINERIRVPEVRLVGPGGEQVGVVRVEDALRLAEEAGLDLVEVAPDAKPPVAKLMDYGKYKYEAAQKARDARRNQANTQLKEIRFRLKIDDHDFSVKKGHVERFLSAGDKVKVMIMFRGREQSRPEAGVRLLQRLAEEVGELAIVESMPRQDGRNMTMVLAPTKRKSDAVNEQRKRREAEREERRGKRAERASKEQARAASQEADAQKK